MDLLVLKAARKAFLEALVATDGPLDGCKLMLFSNDDVPDEDTAYGDLTPCAFTGYAASADLVWNDPYLDNATGDWVISFDPVTFRSITGSPYVGDNCYGWCLYLPGTPNVARLIKRFDEYFGFGVPDRLLTITAELTADQLLYS